MIVVNAATASTIKGSVSFTSSMLSKANVVAISIYKTRRLRIAHAVEDCAIAISLREVGSSEESQTTNWMCKKLFIKEVLLNLWFQMVLVFCMLQMERHVCLHCGRKHTKSVIGVA